MHFKHKISALPRRAAAMTLVAGVFRNIFMTTWLVLAWLCCTAASAATSISAVVTPSVAAAPANVTLSVVVTADPEPVTVAQVEYFNGTTSLGVASGAPFSLNLTDVNAGTYAIVAKATLADPQQPVLVSAPTGLTITGATAAAKVYFIHTDQLNTPRAVTDQSSALVWQWNSDAFGSTPANATPSSASPFVFSLRFPGQSFDAETNLHYNYFRDYDPQTGRYIQSDPIGLQGGINTYGYVGGNPLRFTDPNGLQIVVQRQIIPPGGATADPSRVTNVVVDDGNYSRSRSRENSADSRTRKPMAASSFPPGVWPGDKGADEWGRRNGHGAKEGRGRFHGVKQDCPGSKATDVFGVNPETGDVYDPDGEVVGNLEDAKRK